MMHKPAPLIASAMIALALISSPAVAAPDWNTIGQALGKTGTLTPSGVYRVGLPRSDLNVVLDGITLKPTFALGSWVAFVPMGDKVMVMGDLVLTEDEVGPVMKKLEEEHIDISALHNHLFHASPATFYMHIYAEGDGVAIAKSVHGALSLSKTPFVSPSAPNPVPEIDLDTAAIDKALDAQGSVAGGVYQFAIPRREPVKDHGMVLPTAIGASEAINFQPLGGGKAAITGDFMLTAAEVNPVLRALREYGIEVTALHNHMLDDDPRLFFIHFWAHDDLSKLLTGLHAALGQVAVQHSAAK
jgi:hypothetical protein